MKTATPSINNANLIIPPAGAHPVRFSTGFPYGERVRQLFIGKAPLVVAVNIFSARIFHGHFFGSVSKKSISPQNLKRLSLLRILKGRDVTNPFSVLLYAMRLKIPHEVQQRIHVFHRPSCLQLSLPLLITAGGMTNEKMELTRKTPPAGISSRVQGFVAAAQRSASRSRHPKRSVKLNVWLYQSEIS
jgi:hypothetical protein